MDVLQRLIEILRQKPFDLIARLSVITGLGLIIESQVNIFQALIVALFEEFIAKSDWLRSIVDGMADPGVGIYVFTAALIYHVIISLGLEYIAIFKASAPKIPVFDLQISTLSGKASDASSLRLDGLRFDFEKWVDFPDYIDEAEILNVSEKTNGKLTLGLLGQMREDVATRPGAFRNGGVKSYVNKNLYRERAFLLKEWLGYEPLTLSLSNKGEQLASDLRVQLVFPVSDNLNIKEPGASMPIKPEKSRPEFSIVDVNHDERLSSLLNFERSLRYALNDNQHEVIWEIKKLQAGSDISSRRKLLFKVTGPVLCKCTIFCDQIPKPYTFDFWLQPTSNVETLGFDALINDEEFNRLYAHICNVFKDD